MTLSNAIELAGGYKPYSLKRSTYVTRANGEIEKVKKAAIEFGLEESLEKAIDDGNFELIPSGLSVGMDEEATAVRKKKDASINIAMKLVKEGKAMGVYSA